VEEGFAVSRRSSRPAGRPLTAFCACELRSPAPFTEAGFTAFNKIYVGTLERWGIYDGKLNPIARSNVCPGDRPRRPGRPSMLSATQNLPRTRPLHSLLPGAGRHPKDAETTETTSSSSVTFPPWACGKRRALFFGEMERRMAALGFSWGDTTATQLYTVHNVHPFLADEIVRRGAARSGITWHYHRPPVVDLEYEMDCRGVGIDRTV